MPSPSPAGPLSGLTALVTSGPTYEPLDPVRFIGNRSTGKQGFAIAERLTAAGARTVVVSGPSTLTPPDGVHVVRVETAREMLAACERQLPVDIVVCAAAVADWRVESESQRKLKKTEGEPPVLRFVENPDILRTIGMLTEGRPRLVVGFAAETENVLENARAKRIRKGCDWILANDVSHEGRVEGVFGGDLNRVHLVTADGVDSWPTQSKRQIAEDLVGRIVAFFSS